MPNNITENRFFVEIGTPIIEKTFFKLLPVETGIDWEVESGFKTYEEALFRINEIRSNQPIYHYIK